MIGSIGVIGVELLFGGSFIMSSWEKNVDEVFDFLVGMDFGVNFNLVINIDEFGWDYDGGIDWYLGRFGCMDCAMFGGWCLIEKLVFCGLLMLVKICGKKLILLFVVVIMVGIFVR